MDIYQENGYSDRDGYLAELAEEYEIELETVRYLADILGECEDFDGLVTQLEDMACMF